MVDAICHRYGARLVGKAALHESLQNGALRDFASSRLELAFLGCVVLDLVSKHSLLSLLPAAQSAVWALSLQGHGNFADGRRIAGHLMQRPIAVHALHWHGDTIRRPDVRRRTVAVSLDGRLESGRRTLHGMTAVADGHRSVDGMRRALRIRMYIDTNA